MSKWQNHSPVRKNWLMWPLQLKKAVVIGKEAGYTLDRSPVHQRDITANAPMHADDQRCHQQNGNKAEVTVKLKMCHFTFGKKNRVHQKNLAIRCILKMWAVLYCTLLGTRGPMKTNFLEQQSKFLKMDKNQWMIKIDVNSRVAHVYVCINMLLSIKLWKKECVLLFVWQTWHSIRGLIYFTHFTKRKKGNRQTDKGQKTKGWRLNARDSKIEQPNHKRKPKTNQVTGTKRVKSSCRPWNFRTEGARLGILPTRMAAQGGWDHLEAEQSTGWAVNRICWRHQPRGEGGTLLKVGCSTVKIFFRLMSKALHNPGRRQVEMTKILWLLTRSSWSWSTKKQLLLWHHQAVAAQAMAPINHGRYGPDVHRTTRRNLSIDAFICHIEMSLSCLFLYLCAPSPSCLSTRLPVAWSCVFLICSPGPTQHIQCSFPQNSYTSFSNQFIIFVLMFIHFERLLICNINNYHCGCSFLSVYGQLRRCLGNRTSSAMCWEARSSSTE